MKRAKKKKADSNVVPFKGPEPKDEEQEQIDAAAELSEIVRELAAMDPLEYERIRLAKAIELGVRVEALDRAVRAARRYGPSRQQQPDPNPSDLEETLRPILETEGILDRWIESWDKVMAGEHRNAKLLYLIATSRLFDQCMHAAIKKDRRARARARSERRCWGSSRRKPSSPSPRFRRRRCSGSRATSLTGSCRWARPLAFRIRSYRTPSCAN